MKYEAIVVQIVLHQSQIVGLLAARIAAGVKGIQMTNQGSVALVRDDPQVVNELVRQYAQLFGEASVEVCKSAVRRLLASFSDRDIPESLR